MLYISRKDAVREFERGTLFWNIPSIALASNSYSELRSGLASYAWAREQSEAERHRMRGGFGRARSHYRCILSFEDDAATETVRRLINDWLAETFPTARACAFVHRNTEQLHVHVWIDARATDGKKLDLSQRQWRQIKAKWDRLYVREMKRRDRLESKLFELNREQYAQQTGTTRAIDRSDIGTSQGKSPWTPISASQQAISKCASSRKRALRELGELRAAVEGVSKERGYRLR